MQEFETYVTHLQCSLTEEADYSADIAQGLSRAERPLLVQYNLDAMKAKLDRDAIAARVGDYRAGSFWKWRELLPLKETKNLVSLGECETPTLAVDRVRADVLKSVGMKAGTGRLWIKDESRLATASFKARGLSMAVSKAKELGLTRLAMPTNGNAGSALAAYATRGGLESYVFCPDITPDQIVREIAMQGAKVWRVNGLIHHCAQLVARGKEEAGWFDITTMKEPYRIEGKKTMGIELAEQLGWKLPDAVFYPTGGGTGLVGMWKAFVELKALGWVTGDLPKMVAVQSTGCAPIVRAYEAGEEFATEWMDAETHASGIRLTLSKGDHLVLKTLRHSGGFALSVSEEEMKAGREHVGHAEGLMIGPEGSSTVAGYRYALERGLLDPDMNVVLYNCGSGLKYDMPDASQTLHRHREIDFSALVA